MIQTPERSLFQPSSKLNINNQKPVEVNNLGVTPDYNIPNQVTRLAEALSRLHGPVNIRRETNGYHIHLPSPICLELDGRKELNSKHLTINASRYYQFPEWVSKHGAISSKNKIDYSAMCHKTDTNYKVSDLLNELKFPPLEKRGIKNAGSHVTNSAIARTECLVEDENGNLIPQIPGEVLPLTSLPDLHPAVEYLKNRNYNLQSLVTQFDCSFCYKEQPENPKTGIYYKKLPLNFRDTPQGRIVFNAYIGGVKVGWQARIIDRVNDEGIKEYLQPYSNSWIPVESKDPSTGKWTVMPGIETTSETGFSLLWKPSKYKTAFGMSRNESLMGYDSAVKQNELWQLKKSTAFLVEGPLDAARIGPGAVAMLGKYLSESQASLLTRKFKKVVMVMDNDAAGNQARVRVKEVMTGRNVEVIFADVPYGFKDIGEMDPLDALTFAYSYL